MRLHFFVFMKKLLRFLLNWFPTMIVVGVVIYATWVPKPLDEDTLPLIPGLDKLIHIVMMGGLVGSILFDYKRADRHRELKGRIVAVVTVGVMLFGIFDEVVQGLLPIGRPSDWFDLLADWTGALGGALLAPGAVNACLRRR